MFPQMFPESLEDGWMATTGTDLTNGMVERDPARSGGRQAGILDSRSAGLWLIRQAERHEVVGVYG